MDRDFAKLQSVITTPAQPRENALGYQIPAQFAGSAPGSTIAYGGVNYVINNDNTMSPSIQVFAR